jgi:hypothetical protein
VECDSVEWLSDAETQRHLARVTLAIPGSVDSPHDPQSFVVLISQLSDKCW